MNKWITLALVAALAGGAYWMLRPEPAPQPGAAQGNRPGAGPGNPETGETVAVILPELSAQAQRGQQFFQALCAVCHGPNAGGLDGAAPPLIHLTYRPAHHADMAFVLAARRGVQAHHWGFGNMPPVEGMTDAELRDIITFIREVQVANGIT